MQCEACGGKLVKKDKNTYQCEGCDSTYYRPGSFVKRLQVELPLSRLIVIMVGVTVVLVIAGLLIYQAYTERLVKNAERFSVVFYKFLERAYGEAAANLTEEDLAKLQYLRVDYEGGYRFEYSFENPYDVAEGAYDKASVTVSGKDFDLTDIAYLTGLQKIELFAGYWGDYELAEDNVIRSITCQDGDSSAREPEFFRQTNHGTLEEVIMYAATGANLEELDFLQDIPEVKRLWLERAVLTKADLFEDFGHLEEIWLDYPVIEEKDAFEIIEGILQCPNLKKLTIQGKSGWYITDEEWEQLLDKYGDRVEMERL